MRYKNIPVSEETYQKLKKTVQNKESWDKTVNRLLDEYERRRAST